MNNRNEMLQQFKSFIESLTKFTENQGISIECCNVFEDFLLANVNIPFKHERFAKFDLDTNDASRIQFTISHLTDEEAKRIIAYFHAAGDKDAKAILTVVTNYEFGITPGILRVFAPEKKELEVYQLEVSAQVVYSNLYADFTKALQDDYSKWLYQMKSELFLTRKYGKYPKIAVEEVVESHSPAPQFRP